MTVNAVDAQLIEQLKWTGETVCAAFHVPPYMVGIGPPPPYANVEPLVQLYYSQCLQSLIVSLESHLDYGLGAAWHRLWHRVRYRRFDLDGRRDQDQGGADLHHQRHVAERSAQALLRARADRRAARRPTCRSRTGRCNLLAAREVPTRQPTPPDQSTLSPADEDEDMTEEAALAFLLTKSAEAGLLAA